LRKVLALGLATATLLACVRFETEVFTSNAFAVLRSGPWMAALIFAHNSLAATAVTAGMSFYTAVVEALPERFRNRDVFIGKRAGLFSAAFATLIVFNSLLIGAGTAALNLQLIPLWLPVAIIEAYGMYLATLYPLQRRAFASNMAKVYFVFLIGALVETAIIHACVYGL